MLPKPPSRREILSGLAIGAVSAAMGSPQASDGVQLAPIESMIGTVRKLRDHAHQELRTRMQTGRLARADGYLYTIDAAQLMICLAQLGDRDGYAVLRDHCVKNLIRDRRDDPYTRGFVPWRYKQGDEADASGTTEALRVAKGLWLGSRIFDSPADADLALIVLRGYGMHAAIDQGVWLVRNYFAFQTRAFASNSFLVDYDPDLVREIADATHDSDLSKLANKCLNAVRSSVTACGLLYDLIQPELTTLYPDLPIIAFSPNDVVGIANTGTTALGISRQAPELVRGIVRFAMLNDGNFHRYYLGRSGRPAHDSPAAVCEYAVMIRLAVAVNDPDAVTRLLNRTLAQWHWVADRPELCDTFLYGEMLAATIAVVDWAAGAPASANAGLR